MFAFLQLCVYFVMKTVYWCHKDISFVHSQLGELCAFWMVLLLVGILAGIISLGSRFRLVRQQGLHSTEISQLNPYLSVQVFNRTFPTWEHIFELCIIYISDSMCFHLFWASILRSAVAGSLFALLIIHCTCRKHWCEPSTKTWENLHIHTFLHIVS